MASTEIEKKAQEAFVDDNFELAVDLYTQALDLDPQNPELYADRAQANIKLGSFNEAVSDANKAIELDPSMAKAYLRKGTACMKLEEYQIAKSVLTTGLRLAPGDYRFNRLIKECDDLGAEETKVVPINGGFSPSQSTSTSSDAKLEVVTNAEHQNIVGYQPQEPVPTKPKFRHDYFNTPTELVLTIFAKGIPSQNVHVEFGEQILSISVDIPGEDPFVFQRRLFGKIIPEKCKYIVSTLKIEIHLHKAQAAAWPSLEYNIDKSLPQKIIAQSEVKNQKPSYPYTNTKVQWDKLEADVKKAEKEEKLEGDAALNNLFRGIYQSGDEDMRRAMCKSFVESGGTVLSTNWNEVGSKKVDGSPPEGMEMKKWEY